MANSRNDFRVSVPKHLYKSAEGKADQLGWKVSQYVSALIAKDLLVSESTDAAPPEQQTTPKPSVNLWG